MYAKIGSKWSCLILYIGMFTERLRYFYVCKTFYYSQFHPEVLIACAIYALATGILEELVCRVLLFQNMYLKWKNNNLGAFGAVIVSSVVFGLCHLLNISAGVTVTLFQVYYAIIAGIIFAVMYLMSRNIWVCIICHFLIDFCSNGGYAFMPNENAMALSGGLSSIDVPAIIIVAFMTVGAVYALGLLLTKKPEFKEKNKNGIEKETYSARKKMGKGQKLIVVIALVVVILLIAGGYLLTAQNTTVITLPEGKEWVCELKDKDTKMSITFDDEAVTLTYPSFGLKENELVCTNQTGETYRYKLIINGKMTDAVPEE